MCLQYGVCRCNDLKVQLTAVSAVTRDFKTGFGFGRLEYTVLEFIIVIIILTHGIAYSTVFIHAAPQTIFDIMIFKSG